MLSVVAASDDSIVPGIAKAPGRHAQRWCFPSSMKEMSHAPAVAPQHIGWVDICAMSLGGWPKPRTRSRGGRLLHVDAIRGKARRQFGER